MIVLLQRRMLALAFFLAACAGAPAAWADDPDRDVSSAQLVTGGLLVGANPNIWARSESVTISPRAVTFRYDFKNTSTRDVSLDVAFSLPEMSGKAMEDSGASIPDGVSANFLDFTALADGSPVHPRLEQRALVAGVDRTETLRRLGVPLDPYSDADAVIDALGRLSSADKMNFARLKLAWFDDAGGDPHPRIRPAWGVKTTYVWRQTFPAGRQTVLELKYSPSVGLFPHPSCCVQAWLGSIAMRTEARRYCVGPDIVAAVNRWHDSGDVAEGHYSEAYVDLELGAAGARKVRDFRLVIDKGDEANLVSFCGDGVRKTGPTRFEIDRTIYAPSGVIAVLFLEWNPSTLAGPS